MKWPIKKCALGIHDHYIRVILLLVYSELNIAIYVYVNENGIIEHVATVGT
jgi:hypothetical protein